MCKAPRPTRRVDLGDFFARYVAGTDELPLADWLSRAGLTLRVTGERRVAPSDEPAQTYEIEEMAHPTEKQLHIRDGLLKGTVDHSPLARAAGTLPDVR